MDDAESRAERRRRTWTGGVAHSFEEMDAEDLRFWLAMTPTERLLMVWPLVQEALALRGSDGAAPRLQRSVGGVRRR